MRKILPHPLLSFSLLVLWLILQQSVSVGNLLLGGVIALAAGKAMSALTPERIRVRRPWLIVRLVGLVLYDIMRSNIAVASIILTQGRSPQSAGFLVVPLKLRSRTALSFLAIIMTSTPGTVWLEFDEPSGELLIHVLDLVDEETWLDIIKNRYERMLLEILE